jgi:hypothetical protein
MARGIDLAVGSGSFCAVFKLPQFYSIPSFNTTITAFGPEKLG